MTKGDGGAEETGALLEDVLGAIAAVAVRCVHLRCMPMCHIIICICHIIICVHLRCVRDRQDEGRKRKGGLHMRERHEASESVLK